MCIKVCCSPFESAWSAVCTCVCTSKAFTKSSNREAIEFRIPHVYKSMLKHRDDDKNRSKSLYDVCSQKLCVSLSPLFACVCVCGCVAVFSQLKFVCSIPRLSIHPIN